MGWVCVWACVVVMGIGALAMLREGLLEETTPPKSRGAGDVFAACIVLSVVAAAAVALWHR